uniref:Uncharacterized protein n=1 Tax=Anopheles merus TaxID=30066 RepID=A0A182UVV0_ANOME
MSGSETKQGDILCIGEIFESIAGKDEQTLARTLERSSIKTMLLFESVYGISPLLHCARTGDMSHLGLVRCLLKSGLCDSETVDSKGRTVLAGLVGAHAQTERTAAVGYLERMIEIVIEGADDSTACYRMLKHNSLPLFKAFLSLKQYDEGRLFECLTCALTKLRVKLFILAVDLELFVLGILADYEFRHFSGNWTGGRGKTVDEWKAQAGVVIDCWSVIGKRVQPANVETFQDCLKRTVMTLGEMLKNTKSTPNMPNGRLKQAMGCMITRRFADIVISLRNSYARPFSLSQLLIDANLERRVYSSLPQQTVVIRMVMNLLFVVQMAEVRRSFYGMLMRCGSLDALRSLLIYTSKQDVFSTPIQTVFGQVTQYFAKAKGLLAELSENPVGNTVEFSQLEDQFQVQCGIVDEVKAMLAAEKVLDYESLHQKCISCNDLPTIRRLLHSKINAYRPNAVLESIGNRWNGNGSSILRVPGMVVRLSGIDTELVCNELARIVDATREAKTSYKNHTSQLIEDLNISEEVDDVEGVEQLTELLAPYYENIFLLDKKWSVLRSFCKQRRLPWNETDAQRLRQRDEQQLQAMYDERHRKLQTILARPDFRQVDPVRRNIIVQEDMNATLEQLQLELCAILTAVGYFGTSFQRIKQGIPLIQGRNYRNLLAHDSLSYNMLSDSGDVKKTVNALVFNRLQIRVRTVTVTVTTRSTTDSSQLAPATDAAPDGPVDVPPADGTSSGPFGMTFSCVCSSVATSTALLIVFSSGYLPLTGGGIVSPAPPKSLYVSASGAHSPLKSSVSTDHTIRPASFCRTANRTLFAIERVLSYTTTCEAVPFDLIATISEAAASHSSVQSSGLRFSSSHTSL